MPAAISNEKKIRTTVSLPKPVYEEARSFVGKNARVDTMSAFFVSAIVAYLKLLKRKEIDARFAAMSGDTEHLKEAKLISEEFSQTDWEAFESVEKGG